MKHGNHYERSGTSRRDITDREHEIITGCLLGDGTLGYSKYPRLQVSNKSIEFLQWIESQIPDLVSNISGPDEKGRYLLYTHFHPDLQSYTEWYSTGQKRFPDISLTPKICKIWYAGDGHLNLDGEYCVISVWNERDRIGEIADMFNKVGFEVQTSKQGHIRFRKEPTMKFHEWLGDPVPGYEGKWVGGEA